MIYLGHGKFYKKDGFKLCQKYTSNQKYGVMYGKYDGCNIKLIYEANKNGTLIPHISISILKNNEKKLKETVNEIESHINIDSVYVEKEEFLVTSIKNNRKSLKYESVKECIEYMCTILHKYEIYNNGCENCQKSTNVKTVLIQGYPNILCDSCIEELKQDTDTINKAYEDIPNNYLKGLLGGILGGVLGGFLAALIIFMIHNISSPLELVLIVFVMFLGTKIGYTKIGGKLTLKGRLIILLSKLISWGLVFIGVVLADYFTQTPTAVFDFDTVFKVLSDPLYKTKFVGGMFVVLGICTFFLEIMILIISILSIPKGERNDNLINIEIEK